MSVVFHFLPVSSAEPLSAIQAASDFFFHWDHAEEPLFTMKEFEQQARKSGFATVKRCNYAGLDFCFKFQKPKECVLS